MSATITAAIITSVTATVSTAATSASQMLAQALAQKRTMSVNMANELPFHLEQVVGTGLSRHGRWVETPAFQVPSPIIDIINAIQKGSTNTITPKDSEIEFTFTNQGNSGIETLVIYEITKPKNLPEEIDSQFHLETTYQNMNGIKPRVYSAIWSRKHPTTKPRIGIALFGQDFFDKINPTEDKGLKLCHIFSETERNNDSFSNRVNKKIGLISGFSGKVFDGCNDIIVYDDITMQAMAGKNAVVEIRCDESKWPIEALNNYANSLEKEKIAE